MASDVKEAVGLLGCTGPRDQGGGSSVSFGWSEEAPLLWWHRGWDPCIRLGRTEVWLVLEVGLVCRTKAKNGE